MISIDEIKSKYNIVDYIGSQIELKKKGANYVSCCPFHGEKTPSLTVSQSKQIFKCYGCGAGGDIIEWVKEYDKVSTKEAINKLKEMANMEDFKPTKIEPQPKKYAKDYKTIEKSFTNPQNYMFWKSISLKDAEQEKHLNNITPKWLLKDAQIDDKEFFIDNGRWIPTRSTMIFKLPDYQGLCHTYKYRYKEMADGVIDKWVSEAGTRSHYLYSRLNDNPITLFVEGTRDFLNACLLGYSVIAKPAAQYTLTQEEVETLKDRVVVFIDDNDGKDFMIPNYKDAIFAKKWFDHKEWGLDGKDLSDYLYHFDNIESFKEKFENYIESIKTETIEEKWRYVLDNITKPLNDEDISKIENMEFLYPELIIKNNITTIVAQANTGKSAFTFGLCKELMEDKLKDIFFLDPDSNVSYVKPILEELKDKPFHYYNGIKSNTQDMIRLLETMAALPIGSGKDTMVVCDGLQFFVNGSASEDKNSKGFLELLKKVRDRFGATIILLHHAKREKDENGNSQYLGSQVLESSTDNMLMMQVRDNIEIVVQKSRADKKNNIYNLEMDFEHRVIKSVTLKGDSDEADTDVDITISQEDIIDFMREKDWIAISNIQKHFKCHRNKARRDLIWNMLKDDKDIEVKKEGKGWKAKLINKEPDVIEYDDEWMTGLL
jgi:hypothetical protein